jgi:O-antigen/teichoic acid export membrane protein
MDEPTSSAVRPEPRPTEDVVTGTGARVLRGSVWQIGSTLAPYVLTTFVSVVAARVLGPDQMGRQSYIAFIVLTVITFCNAGFSAAVPRYVGELMGRGEPGKLRSLVVWSWRIELVAAVVGAGVLIAVAAAGATPRAAWAFGAVAVFAGVLHKVPGSLLLGGQRWRQNGIVVLTTTTASAVATVVVLLLGGGITGMFAVLAAANVVMLLWGTVLARHLFGGASIARQPLGRLGREIVRFGMIASVPIVLGFVVSQRSEFFFLEHYSTNTQIALYSIAFSAYLAIVAAPIAIGNMIAPAVGALHGAGESRRIRSGYARGLRLLLLVTIPLTVGAVVFGPALIRLLYGDQYRGAGTIVLILLAPLPIVPLAGLSSGVLVGLARIGFPVAVSIVGVVVDLGLAALLVPHLAASGAAIANIAAQIGKAILVIWYSVRLVGGVHLAPRHLVKVTAAAVAGGGCARLVLAMGESAWLFVLAVAIGASIFTALAFLLRVLPRDDADWLTNALGNRTASRVTRIFDRLAGPPLGTASPSGPA